MAETDYFCKKTEIVPFIQKPKGLTHTCSIPQFSRRICPDDPEQSSVKKSCRACFKTLVAVLLCDEETNLIGNLKTGYG